MINKRTYGNPPFIAAVVHGGPGACGELAPVARALSTVCGVLEPIQTQITIDEQVEELASAINTFANVPIVLVGHSWGAWLSYLTAARYPALVKKLILIGSGSYEERYVEQMVSERYSRYSKEEQAEYDTILALLKEPEAEGKHAAYHRLGALVAQADAYHPMPSGNTNEDMIDTGNRSYHAVLEEVQQMRRDGSLLNFAHCITCPVVAIHGDYDTRPIQGVEEPLARKIADFRMIVLPKCGHTPWTEKYARDEFYRVLINEVIFA